MTKYKLVIHTPRTDHYVELRSPVPISLASGGDRRHEGFSELFIVRGERRLRLVVDEEVTSDLLPPDFGWLRSALVMSSFDDDDTLLDERGWREFKVHVSSPVVPRGKGLWLRITLEYDKKADVGLHIVSGAALMHDPDNDAWEHLHGGPPDWLGSQPDKVWVIENGRKRRPLAVDNPLLSIDWDGAGFNTANLVHIDPGRKGKQDSDYWFGLHPVPRGNHSLICTELSVSPDFGTPPLVSDYALLLADERRGGAPLAAHGLHLFCEARQDDQCRPTGWRLQWLQIPGAQGSRPRHTFSLESFTQLHLGAHAYGLATTRARNRLSMIPTWIATSDEHKTCDMVFDVERRDFRASDTRLRGVLFREDTAVSMTCGGALDVEGEPLQWLAVVSGSPALEPPEQPSFLKWELTPAQKIPKDKQHRFGAGSVLIEAQADSFAKGGTFSLALSPEGRPYRRAPLESDLKLEFTQTGYRPLSMDPEIGFETLSSVVERPRPWTVDLGTPKLYALSVREHAKHDQSRILRLTLRMDREERRDTDVVLVDTSPFTVVRVKSSEKLQKRSIFAEYVDDADQAPEWRFYSEFGKMTAVLPPQGIGEEMVKGHLFLSDNGTPTLVPRPCALFDFRLTPPALLELDRTDVDTARSEASWSLRRLLARRSGTTGVKLDRARFELLYGLQANLETPGLRIAELEGFVGRIPFPDGLWNAYLRQQQGDDDVEERYAGQVARWQSGLWNRPSWWRVYRDVTERHRLTLDSGVVYRLRDTRQTADPFSIGNYATEGGKKADSLVPHEPLRGGVDWPFQSRNVYTELLRKPVSSAGSIEGLVFGSLGGEGTQTAAFNNGKTLIISSSRQGRLDSLTLIRIGRIAMTWNKARHVIVYERTTRRAPRYVYGKDDTGQPDYPGAPKHDDLEVQPPFPGIAALRKVREYVEITEPRRRYPDTPTDRPAAGPLVQCAFGTTVIPVMSSWSHDVTDGFVISLRGPIPKGKEPFFPDPHVFLDLARAPDKGGGSVSQRITSTERLVFFSSTRDEDGGDTDLWPAWPDIDFPSIAPPPSPPLPFRSGFQGRRQPDAEAIDPLMEPFTLELAPAQEGVNLMHGRNSDGIEAKVSNFNLARGLPSRESVPTTGKAAEAQAAAEGFSSARALLVDGLRDITAAVRDRAAATGASPVGEDAHFRRDLGALLQKLGNAEKPDLSKVPKIDWVDQQKARAQSFQAGIAKEGKALAEELNAQQRRIEQGLAPSLEQARLEAATLATAVTQQAKERLGTLGLIGAEAVRAGGDFLGNWLDTHGLRLERIATAALADVDALEKQLAAQPARLLELESIWLEAVGRIPRELYAILDTLNQLPEGAAGKLFSRLAPGGGEGDTLFARTRSALEPVLRGAAEWLARWIEALAPFEIEEPDFAAMRKELATVLDAQVLKAALQDLLDEFKKLFDDLGAWDAELQKLRAAFDDEARQLQQKIAGAKDLKELAAEIEKEAKAVGTRLENAATTLVSQMTVPTDVQKALDKLQGSFDALQAYSAEVDKAIAGIEASMNGTLAELEQAVQSHVGQAEAFLQAGSRQLEDWARGQIAPALEIGRRNVDATLEAVRILAEGPVTEGLRATRDQLGYYYRTAADVVDLTPASAIFNDLGKEVLNALSASVPFDQLAERLLPKLEGILVRDLFPDFCGIKLGHLLPDLDVKLDDVHQYDWLTVQHGFDKDRLSAWARVSINKRFDEGATLFDLGPVKLRLLDPLFFAVADIVNENGRQRQITSGRLEADFELSLNDKPMVTMADGVLSFDERGKLDFNFDSEKLELAKELDFISKALRSLMPQVEGLTLTPLLPAGIDAEISLPLPDIGTGAFTLTGITLNAHLGLLVGDGFEIRTGLWLSKPERPFGMAVLFLGGGGWFGIDANYKPPERFVTRVSIGISAGAFVALNFGFASGSAGLLFTAGVDYFRDWQTGSGSTAVSLGLLIWGEFSILGIASAGVRLVLRITYTDQGGMKGTGTLSVKIKICWCYTLRVNRTVQKVFSGGSGQQGRKFSSASAVAAATPAPAIAARLMATDPPAYGELPKPNPQEAVERYFNTLAI